MTKIDRLLQRWRFAKAARFIPRGARVLDVGSDDGALFRYLGERLGTGTGIDPLIAAPSANARWRLIPGMFPDDAPLERFDAITALAVLEHIPEDSLPKFRDACIEHLEPGGRFIATVPSPAVDRILHVLERLRLIHGMALHEHHGFDAMSTPRAFEAPALRLARARRFQLGLNHLFVFERPAPAASLAGEDERGNASRGER